MERSIYNDVKKYWPSMTTEAVRSEETGCGTEEVQVQDKRWGTALPAETPWL